MKKITLTILFTFLLLTSTRLCFSANTKTVDVKAEIPPLNALTVSITKYSDSGQIIGTNEGSVNFGTLSYDSKEKIFKAACFYAVDAFVDSNESNWMITHNVESIRHQSRGETLDRHIIVTFFQWHRPTVPGPVAQLGKFSFADSTGKAYNSTVLPGKGLRIIYEIAKKNDTALGVTHITDSKPIGQYQGRITVTFVAQQ